MNNEQIVELLQKLQGAISNSTESVQVCTPSSDYYLERNNWCEEIIKFVNPDRLYSEISDIIKQYET